MSRGDLKLEWVLHDGAVVHVQAFAALQPHERPSVTCPECGETVIPHLGRQVRHHAAHRSASRCRLAAGESALHLNVKLHIAHALRASIGTNTTLRLVTACAEPGCQAQEEREWLTSWDEVAVEYRLADGDGVRIPDILVRALGRDVGAIEVRATNEVSELREKSFERLALPFVEVRADAALITEPDVWTAARPLPIEREGGRARWRCEEHAIREQQAVLHAARVVDIFYPNGTALRHVFRIDIHYENGAASAVVLSCSDDIVARVPISLPLASASRIAALQEAAAAYERDVQAYREHGGAVVDSPMSWASGGEAQALVLDASAPSTHRRVQFRKRYPRRYRYLKPARRWWLPADMEVVNWNHDDTGPFDEHPALRHVREAARARYRLGRKDG